MSPDSVWRYYQLVNVLWASDPLPESQSTPPGKQAPLQTYTMRSSGPDTPVANTTMETYAQTSNCTDCHRQATIASGVDGGSSSLASDFSFLFSSAQRAPGR